MQPQSPTKDRQQGPFVRTSGAVWNRPAVFTGVATVAYCALMVFAGLWPFTFCPLNRAVWCGSDGGITFSRPAAVYDVKELDASRGSVLAESTVTITIRVRTAGKVPRFVSQMVSFSRGDRLFAVIGDWKSHLVLQRFGVGPWPNLGRKYECAVRGVLQPHIAREIVIVTGPGGTKIFVDKREVMSDWDFRLFGGGAGGPVRLALGGTLTGKYTWNGTIYGFSMILGDASRRLIAHGDAPDFTGCDGTEPGRLIVGYAFRVQDSVVNSCAGDGHALAIRKHFPIIGGNMLVPFWDDFTNDESYYADIAVNILGFAPFGFLLSLFLIRARKPGKNRIIPWVVAAGLAFSLGIELAQVYLPGRSSQMSDIITDTAGTYLGALACYLVLRIRSLPPTRPSPER